jgi:hypothetical protein
VYVGSIPAADTLFQGDLCAQVSLPIVLGETVAIPLEGKAKAEPAISLLERDKALGALAVKPLVGPVLILSQSCDIADVARRQAGRILIAPILPEEKSTLLDQYREVLQDWDSPEFIGKILEGEQLGHIAKDVTQALARNLNKKFEALKKLWLGNVVGAFPLAEKKDGSAITLPRSICHFDHVVSVPHEWLPYLQRKRFARLDVTWLSILQESLADWVGRFAYPGSNDDRCRVGLAAEMAENQKPAQ